MIPKNVFAIVNNVKTNHTVIAVCEWATYDVWGNSRNGFEVNDKYNQGEIEIPATMTIHGVPAFPGAKDKYRSFPSSGSFSTELAVSFTLTDKDIKKALDITCKFDVDGDDLNYYINKKSNGKPLCEIRIVSWKSAK